MLRGRVLARYASTLPNKSKYIILGANKSRILPRRKQPQASAVDQEVGIKTRSVEESRKELMVFRESPDLKLVVDGINWQKPQVETVSSTRFNQLAIQLGKSFTVAQLRQYITHNGMFCTAKCTKGKAIDTIMTHIWNLQISSDIEESSDVIVENTLPVNKRDLVLILSRNGKILRDWTKSGAKIIVRSDRLVLRVRSTQETFDWILASYHSKLGQVISKRLDIEQLSQFGKLDDNLLSKVQRLSNCYIAKVGEKEMELEAFAFSTYDLQLAERLILEGSGYYPHTTGDYVRDVTPVVERNSNPVGFVDDDSMPWIERARNWVRQQTAKLKVSPEKRLLDEDNEEDYVHYRTLQFGDKQEVGELTHEKMVDKLAEHVNQRVGDGDNPLTLSATFGYALQDETGQTFASNIPRITEKVTELLQFNDMSHTENEQPLSGDDAWKQILSKRQVVEDEPFGAGAADNDHLESSCMVQLRLVPSPNENTMANLKSLPAVEVWLELDAKDQADISTRRVFAVKHESNTIMSMPDQPADVKYTATRAQVLDTETENGVLKMLQSSSLDFATNRVHISADSVDMDIDGQTFKYAYHSLFHRRQSEYNYKGHLMLLSVIEGGGVGGRRVEAQLMYDFESAHLYSQQDARKMVAMSLEFLKTLRQRPASDRF